MLPSAHGSRVIFGEPTVGAGSQCRYFTFSASFYPIESSKDLYRSPQIGHRSCRFGFTEQDLGVSAPGDQAALLDSIELSTVGVICINFTLSIEDRQLLKISL